MPAADLATVLTIERDLMNDFALDYNVLQYFNSYFYAEERRRFIEWMLHLLRRSGHDPDGLSILEAGVSTGEALRLLAEAGCRRLTGLDIAQRMLDQARQRVPFGRFILGSVEEHDFGNERFDVIIAGFTLHHMHDPGAFFDLARRVLQPGGWFFVIDYNADGWENARWTKPFVHALAAPGRRLLKWKNRRALARQPKNRLQFNPAHRLLTFREIVAAISPAEFTIVRRRTRGLFLPAFNYALVQDSSIDHTVARILNTIDRIAEPFGAGNLQWIAGRRYRTAVVPGAADDA